METFRFFRLISPSPSNSRIFNAFHQKPPTSTLNASFYAPQLIVFTVFTVIFFRGETLHWNHFVAFVLLIIAVWLVFLDVH